MSTAPGDQPESLRYVIESVFQLPVDQERILSLALDHRGVESYWTLFILRKHEIANLVYPDPEAPNQLVPLPCNLCNLLFNFLGYIRYREFINNQINLYNCLAIDAVDFHQYRTMLHYGHKYSCDFDHYRSELESRRLYQTAWRQYQKDLDKWHSSINSTVNKATNTSTLSCRTVTHRAAPAAPTTAIVTPDSSQTPAPCSSCSLDTQSATLPEDSSSGDPPIVQQLFDHGSPVPTNTFSEVSMGSDSECTLLPTRSVDPDPNSSKISPLQFSSSPHLVTQPHRNKHITTRNRPRRKRQAQRNKNNARADEQRQRPKSKPNNNSPRGLAKPMKNVEPNKDNKSSITIPIKPTTLDIANPNRSPNTNDGTLQSKADVTTKQHGELQHIPPISQVIKPSINVETPNDNVTVKPRQLTYLEATMELGDRSQDDEALKLMKLASKVVKTNHGELHRLVPDGTAKMESKDRIRPEAQLIKRDRTGTKSKVDEPSNELVVTTTLTSCSDSDIATNGNQTFSEASMGSNSECTLLPTRSVDSDANSSNFSDKIGIESKVDKHELVVTTTTLTPKPNRTCSDPDIADDGNQTIDRIDNTVDAQAINDPCAISDEPPSTQHGKAIATNNQLTHVGDERFNSSSLPMEPSNHIEDSSFKSDNSCVTFTEPITLDVTVNFDETIDSDTDRDGLISTKFQLYSESPKLDYIDRGTAQPFDTDLSCINDDGIPELETNEVSILELVDISNNIEYMFNVVKSTLDDAFESFFNASDSDSSIDGDSLDSSSPNVELKNTDLDLIDPNSIDLEVRSDVKSDILLEIKANGTTKPPPVARVMPSPPSNPRSKSHWEPSEKDGERPHRARKKDGEYFGTHSSTTSRPPFLANHPLWTNSTRAKNPSSAVKSREHGWKRLRRQAAWLPKLVTNDKNHLAESLSKSA